MSSSPIPMSAPSFCSKNCTFQDNSYLPIGLTILPFVGHFIQGYKEVTIAQKIQYALNEGNNDEAAKLTETRNKYKYVGIAREILLAAATITVIALGLLNPIFGAICATAFLVLAGIHAYRALHNVTHIINPHKEGKDFTSAYIR